MGIWDSLKSFGSTIWDGIKQGANGVLGVANKIRDGIGAGYNFVKGIPVIGNLVDKGLDRLKIGGVGVKDLAGMASDALDAGNSVNGYINPPSQVAVPSQADEIISRLPAPQAPAKATVPPGTVIPQGKGLSMPNSAPRSRKSRKAKI
jgi:hypothetical protein